LVLVAHHVLSILRRRLFDFLTILSLLLCLAIAALYVRAFTCRDEIHTSIFRHDCIIASFPHHVHVILAAHASIRAYDTSLTHGLGQYPSRSKYLQPRLSSTGLYWEISVPFWLPLLFAGALPVWFASTTWQWRRRARLGLCPHCGYDLRATPGRCPECGHVPQAPAPAHLTADHPC
jgi:hypothetical protein